MNREVKRVSIARPAMDGDGVALKRNDLFDGRLDPFLMLDELKALPTDSPNGFPVHPHRGIQTLSYIIDGFMSHQDSMGNQSKITAGSLQWMHTGKGIEHSETPGVDTNGLWGFQFWLNVPRDEKYQAPQYQDVAVNEQIIIEQTAYRVKVLAGEVVIGGKAYQHTFQSLAGDANLVDIEWSEQGNCEISTPNQNAAVFVLTGTLTVNDAVRTYKAAELIELSEGESIQLTGNEGTRVLFFSGNPIGEPIVHRGPFVMTSDAEIMQTIQAYRDGTLVS